MRKQLHGAAGFSLLELLIASAIFLVVMTAVYLMYATNQTTFVRGEMKSDLQQNARIGLDRLTRELRMAGFGIPTAEFPAKIQPIITAATADSLTFLADVEGVTTDLTAVVNVGATVLPVVSVQAGGFKVEDTVYITDGSWWEQVTVTATSVPDKTLTVTPPLIHSYAIGSMVSRPREIRYFLDGTILRRDGGGGGGAQPLAEKLAALSYTYYDAAGGVISLASLPARLSDIRRIGVLVTTADAFGQAVETYTVTADVTPPNLRL